MNSNGDVISLTDLEAKKAQAKLFAQLAEKGRQVSTIPLSDDEAVLAGGMNRAQRREFFRKRVKALRRETRGGKP